MGRKRLGESILGPEASAIALPPHAGAKGLAAFANAAKSFKSFRPARETLKRVRAVPTVFPQLDHATRVGGWPIDRVAVIHGVSNEGKTLLMHGIGLSFLQRGHIYALIDAEMTTPITWLENLYGAYADADTFLASRPKSYEEAVDDVRRLCTTVHDLRSTGKVPPDTTALIVVDSIRKLVPEDLIARIKKSGASGDKGSVDGFGGAAGRMRAGMNAAWLDELVPLVYHAGCAITFIARESEDPNADARDKMFGNDWKMSGGKALEFDSSLIARVKRDDWIRSSAGDYKSPVIGERHRVDIRKTKVAGKQDKIARSYFHTSNGVASPEGFDRARDVLELASRLEVVRTSGSWLTWGKYRWQGEARAVDKLRADPEVMAELEAAAREKFQSVNPPEEAPR